MNALTPRGRSVLALAAGSLVSGRVLALRELHMLAAGLIALLAIAFGLVLYRRLQLSVRRKVSPTRTQAPGEVRVELTVSNSGTIAGGPLLLQDRLPEKLSATARLSLPSLAPQTDQSAAYILRPRVRGFYQLGPLELAVTDPFGLFLRRQSLPGVSTVVVYPSFERVRTLPQNVQRAGAIRRSPLLGVGDEFYALRAYEEGDDLRKVHWPTTLKLGEPYVRQDELLVEPGLFVVLDSCLTKHRGMGTTASIEAAISACASVATLGIDHGMALDVLTSDGLLLQSRRPTEDELLEALALLDPSPRSDLVPALTSAARRRVPYTSLIVISPSLSDAELAMLARMAQRTAGGACVHVQADTFGAGEPSSPGRLGQLGIPVVPLRSQDSFHDVWEGGVRRAALAR